MKTFAETFQLSIGIMALGSSIQFLASLFYLPELFLAGRFLTGVFSPLADVATVMYLNESPPMEMRGKFSYLSAIFYSMLAALGMLLGMRSVLGYSFSLLLGIQLPPMFLSLIFLFFCLPDTPPYLMINK
jgi:MFS family permease